MNASEGKAGLGSLFGPITELLKNPLVLEGAVAGISAISAARRAKNPRPAEGGFDLGSIMEMLPQMLPLISMLSSAGGAGAVDTNANGDGSREVFAEGSAEGEGAFSSDGMLASEGDTPLGEDSVTDGGVPVLSGNVSGGTRQDKRENLLLALRPFLSESRVAAADAIIQVNRISGIFGT